MKPSSESLMLLAAALIVAAGGQALAQASDWTDAAYCMSDPRTPWPYEEGNDAINEAKKGFAMAGATVHAFVRNTADTPGALAALTWNGTPVKDLRQERSVVWWRLLPAELPPGEVGEVILRLRRPMDGPGALGVSLTNGHAVKVPVAAEPPAFRLESVAFGPNLTEVFLYVERDARRAPLPDSVVMDTPDAPVPVRWLSDAWTDRLRVGVVELPQPLGLCSRHTWVIRGGGATVGASLRAIPDPAVFGTYGSANYARQAEAGLTSFYSFAGLNAESVDKADEHGVRPAFYIGGGEPPEDVRGRANVYGYCIKDEPDCHDYSADQDIPMSQRIGTLAPEMVAQATRCESLDPDTPVLLTLNLTFTPANYYTYGPVADITTPDCYPVTVGKSLEFLRDCAAHAKRGTAPRMMGFIYQGSWEEFLHPDRKEAYYSKATLIEKGFEAFRDPDRVRGLGRKPTPAEVRIMMHYALGSGARALWSYIDATEACGGLVFHGSDVLPEIWDAIGATSRAMNHARADVNLA
ncbi:MAG: hypothetical protein GY851_18320, partial [bacterium]|nr:hypothetical protein [bacterium]